MKDFSENTFVEIQQDLSMMIEQYGLPEVLKNFSQLAKSGHLEQLEVDKLTKIATYLSFAANMAHHTEEN